MPGFASTDFRAVLSTFATGVTVVTTSGQNHSYGMTANAFSSVSLDPPLILVCVIANSEGSTQIEQNGCFAVNILHADQEPLSRYFASRDRPRGRDAFREVTHHTSHTGSPILDGAAGFMDCHLHTNHPAGDHQIFIGEVIELGSNPQHNPLIFHNGHYHTIQT
jgi:flavin reductase (DIM6/NTAB) family NADH-FMN oxidoreductase RutF